MSAVFRSSEAFALFFSLY